MNVYRTEAALAAGEYDKRLTAVYGAPSLEFQRGRYTEALRSFARLYGTGRDVRLFSVPGRSEISGNHTDHNHGRVIAAAVNVDIIAVAAPNDSDIIRIQSEGFPEDIVSLSAIEPENAEKFDSSALIAGMCAGFKNNGYNYGGFDAYTVSDVLKGSGLSSSAAFEVMVGNILNNCFNDGLIPAPEIAKIAQYAENVFFGKPCGLMDQTACAVGGFVAIDFLEPAKPVIEKMDFDLSQAGYSLCIINTGGSHADLNEDYASIPAEMKAIASYFGRETLRGLTLPVVIASTPALRSEFGDRALLRAVHFISENDRVARQTDALRQGDTETFLDGVTESGLSSFRWLQNVYTVKNVGEQGLSLALCIAENILSGCAEKWAARVHGGGFAGTIQAFVPSACVDSFRTGMDAVFGGGSCAVLSVRADGACEIQHEN
ncbi:MAG: galactokinase family protein [Eubacteriales bacterium]|nr:galactokinase family protein [Eubacteriales bacterium]